MHLNEKDIISLIENDPWRMKILKTVKPLNLPDWWIGSGFVRNKVFDYLHKYTKNTPPGDIDVVYFDPKNIQEETEKEYEKILRSKDPKINWSVKNLARMHIVNGDPPYSSSIDAISHWPETVTAVAVTLDDNNNVIFEAPLGKEDLVTMNVHPSPTFASRKESMDKYRNRVTQKEWARKWPKLVIHEL